jgi:hypothetical protein
LGLPVALLDLAKDGKSIASTLTRIGRSQGVFTVPTPINVVIVFKSRQDSSEFVIANCQDADIYIWLTHYPHLNPVAVIGLLKELRVDLTNCSWNAPKHSPQACRTVLSHSHDPSQIHYRE